MLETDKPTFDPDGEADAIETLRLDLLKAGPTSGLFREKAAQADQLLSRTRDFYRQIAANRRARLESQRQQEKQTELLL